MFNDPSKLTNEEIRRQLAEVGVNAELIDSIVEQFWFHDFWYSFISFPEHMEFLKRYLATKDNAAFSRYEFYKYFFENTFTDAATFVTFATALHKIGMIFELMQTDRLKLTEFVEMLHAADAPEEITLETLKDKKLVSITTEEDAEYVVWVHHTITEFFATEYILNTDEVTAMVERYMANASSGEISFIPTWTGVLRFLLDVTPEPIANWIIDKIESNQDFLNDQLTETIVFETPAAIPAPLKSRIFHAVYDSYQKNKWWIPTWAYHNLTKFIDAEIYRTLKDNADSGDYVYQGNIAATIDGMLIHKNPLITAGEKAFWKMQFISYANDPNTNGVLQRHSLAALENYAGARDIIPAVDVNATSPEQLVREAFYKMCKSVDPNSPEAITLYVRSIENDTAHIYARNGIWGITTATGIKKFFELTAENSDFIHEWIDNDSIFNKEENPADKNFLDTIERRVTASTLPLLKKFILTAFTTDRNYRAGDTYFLQQLAKIIKMKDENYLLGLIEAIKTLEPEAKNRVFINDIEGIIAVLLEPGELETLKGVFANELHQHAAFTLAAAVRKAPKIGNSEGEEILRKGIELGITADPNAPSPYDKQPQKQEEKTFKQFQFFLSTPEKEMFYWEVFRFFLDNQKIIEDKWNDSEKERLLTLCEDVFRSTKPEEIKVKYKNETQKTGSYTITSSASYFGEVTTILYNFRPEKFTNAEERQKVIDFIPFAFGNDLRIIRTIAGSVTDEELITVNRIMMGEPDNDARYLSPGTYAYFAGYFTGLSSPKNVLKSLIVDPLVSIYDRDKALKVLASYLSTEVEEDKTFVNSLWNRTERSSLSDIANGLLISVFKDEEAINWRVGQIKTNAQPFQQQHGAHSVGELEMELTNMAFAKPLLELKDEAFISKMIELLDFSLTKIDKPEYWEYVNYLWKIAIAFVARDKYVLSTQAVLTLRQWASDHANVHNINWFNKRLESNITEVSQKIGKITNVSEAIEKLT